MATISARLRPAPAAASLWVAAASRKPTGATSAAQQYTRCCWMPGRPASLLVVLQLQSLQRREHGLGSEGRRRQRSLVGDLPLPSHPRASLHHCPGTHRMAVTLLHHMKCRVRCHQGRPSSLAAGTPVPRRRRRAPRVSGSRQHATSCAWRALPAPAMNVAPRQHRAPLARRAQRGPSPARTP